VFGQTFGRSDLGFAALPDKAPALGKARTEHEDQQVRVDGGASPMADERDQMLHSSPKQ
jgi:hypothetical protein